MSIGLLQFIGSILVLINSNQIFNFTQNNNMEVVLEILKYTIPSAIVFVGVYFILKSFMEADRRKMEMNYRTGNAKMVTPVKLQAYERMILFLERIALSNLVMRIYNGKMSAKELQNALLAAIRSEYDHNVSQQLYIPTKTWNLIKSTREENVKVINSCAEQLKDDASGLELSRFLLELVGKMDKMPTDVAIEALKKEVNRAF